MEPLPDIYSQFAMEESTHLFAESNACLQSHLRHIVNGDKLDGANIKQSLPVVS